MVEEKKDIDAIIGSHKQTSVLLMVVGILLSTYTINSTGFNALSNIALLVIIFGAYQYYKLDNGKGGLLLIGIAAIYALLYVLHYLNFI